MPDSVAYCSRCGFALGVRRATLSVTVVKETGDAVDESVTLCYHCYRGAFVDFMHGGAVKPPASPGKAAPHA